MMGFVINPGSGPVAGSSDTEAWVDIMAFIDDLGLENVSVGAEATGSWRLDPAIDDGRKGFDLEYDGRHVQVAMPGLMLEQVRWMEGHSQDIWQFPRLYVDGDSWVWFFALNAVRRALTGEE